MAVTLKMPSSPMFRRVALLRTNFSEDCITSIIRVTKIGELLASYANVDPSSPILVKLMMEAIRFSRNVGSYKIQTT
jgi:hypothetical protein